MPSSLTRTEVCQLLGVSSKSLYLWERDGRIPQPRRDRRNWRVYSSTDVEAIKRFLGVGVGDRARTSKTVKSSAQLEGLSARNQLAGTIVGIRRDGLLCEVVIQLGDGQEITSVITAGSAARLGLKKGCEATAVIKATEVMMFR